MSIKTSFSIKDLENLSGVKAHTIRIWEKRYKLLKPERTDTNIRTYDLASLQKILNVALLNHHGYKVSRIAALHEDELYGKVRELAVEHGDWGSSINAFKLSMLNFDQQLFENVYDSLLTQYSFRDIFLNVFIKLLDEIGLLWISRTITPAHEHFISTLIQQKLLINAERIQGIIPDPKKTFVLFLPLNEIHELGLLFIHFQLLHKGYRSIYLGPSVPVDNLLELQKVFRKVVFVSYFTVEPTVEKSKSYLAVIAKTILATRDEKLHIIGRNTRHLDPQKLPPGIVLHKDLVSMVEIL
jgi:MerR family transcriptional regulator, light-induced transcriptional regulator